MRTGRKPCELDSYLMTCDEVKNKIAPDLIHVDQTYISLGENFVRTFAIIDYPSEVQGNWLARLYKFQGNISVSSHLQPVAADKMRKHLDSSIRELEARLEEQLTPTRRKDTQNKLKSAEDLLSTLMDGKNKTIFLVHTYVQLLASSLDELNRLSEQLESVVWKVGITSYVLRNNAWRGFRSILPLVKPEVEEFTQQNMHAAAVSSMIPFDESELFHKNGIVFGQNGHTDNLVLIDQWNKKLYPSRNMVVFGTSGAGKSFFLTKHLLRQYALASGKRKRFMVIDPEREISVVAEKIGGQVIRFSQNTSNIINPLDVYRDGDEDGNGLLFSKLQRLKTFFLLMQGGTMKAYELALLERAILETYRLKGITENSDFYKLSVENMPILSDLFEVIDKREDYQALSIFKEILRVYVTGSNCKLFNGTTTCDLSSDLIIFDIKDLAKAANDAQTVSMYNILSFLWDQITAEKETEKELFIDEAHLLMRTPSSAMFLLDVYKRIRKYSGTAYVATQQPADFFGTEEIRSYGKAVVNNSMFMLLLGMRGSDVKDLKEYDIIRLSEEEEEILTRWKQGEGILVAGNARVFLHVDATKAELKLIDPQQYEALHGKKAGGV